MAKKMKTLFLLLLIAVAPTIKSVNFNKHQQPKKLNTTLSDHNKIKRENKDNLTASNEQGFTRRHVISSLINTANMSNIPLIDEEEKAWKKGGNLGSFVSEKKSKYCKVDFVDYRKKINTDVLNMPMIYFVTTTKPKPEQIPDLIQLSHTLMHVPRIFWIVADDSNVCSEEVTKILRNSLLPFAYISCPGPEMEQRRKTYNWKKKIPQGITNRRAALKFVYKYLDDGILYFGDDDNIYDLDLFNEIRKTKKISMFPLALIGSYGISSPLVSAGKVHGFLDSQFGKDNFSIDMAGFAINIRYLKKYTKMEYEVGNSENNFLIAAGFEVDDVEPLAKNCTEVLIWHKQTVRIPVRNLKIKISTAFQYDNFPALLRQLVKLNIIKFDPKNGVIPKVIQYNKFVMMMRIPLKTF